MRSANDHTFLCGAFVAALSAVTYAHGDERPTRVRLEWTPMPGCTDAAALREQVEQALGRTAFSDDADADLVLVGHIEEGNHDVRAIVTLSKPSGDVIGTRVLVSHRCDELSRGLPLALALMIDLPLREASVRVIIPPSPPPPPPSPPPPPPKPAPISTRSLHVAAIVGPVLRLGAVRTVTLGLRVAGEIGPIGMETTWFTTSPVDDGRVSARMWAASGAAYVCPLAIARAHLRVGACAYLEAGAIIASGRGVSPARTDVAWLFDVGARLRAGLHWPSWTIGLEIGGGPYVVRPSIVYGTPGGPMTLAEAWPATMDIFLGAGVWLP